MRKYGLRFLPDTASERKAAWSHIRMQSMARPCSTHPSDQKHPPSLGDLCDLNRASLQTAHTTTHAPRNAKRPSRQTQHPAKHFSRLLSSAECFSILSAPQPPGKLEIRYDHFPGETCALVCR